MIKKIYSNDKLNKKKNKKKIIIIKSGAKKRGKKNRTTFGHSLFQSFA